MGGGEHFLRCPSRLAALIVDHDWAGHAPDLPHRWTSLARSIASDSYRAGPLRLSTGSSKHARTGVDPKMKRKA